MKKSGYYIRAAFIAVFVFLGLWMSFSAEAADALYDQRYEPDVTHKTSRVSKNMMNKKRKKGGIVKGKSLGMTPDFAYPRSVMKKAEVSLSSELKKMKYPKALLSLIQLTIAGQSVSTDSLPTSLRLCDSVAGSIPAPYSALAQLIQATVLKEAYVANSYQYNSRVLPDNTPSENPFLWNKSMFADSIASLVRKAFTELPAARIPISKAAPAVVDFKEADADGLDLADFIRIAAVNSLAPFVKDWNASPEVIPFYPSEVDTTESGSPFDLYMQSLKALYEEGLEGRLSKRAYIDCFLIGCMRRAGIEAMPFILSELDAIGENPESAYLLYTLYDDAGVMNDFRGAGVTDVVELPSCVPPRPLKLFGRIFPQQPSPSLREIYGRICALERGKLPETLRGRLKQMKDKISEKRMSVDFKSKYLPDDSLRMSVTLRNVSNAYMLVYDVTGQICRDKRGWKFGHIAGSARRVGAFSVSTPLSIPFEEKVSISLPPLPPGEYALILSASPDTDKGGVDALRDKYMETFIVSSLSLGIMTSGDSQGVTRDLIVADGADGSPVSGASVMLSAAPFGEGAASGEVIEGLSDSDGLYRISEKTDSDFRGRKSNGYIYVRASKDGSAADMKVWKNSGYNSEGERRVAAIFTDLPIYHPGDSVGFVGVCSKVVGGRRSLLKNLPVKAELHTPDFRMVDSLSLTTDECGRITGQFSIPKDMLLGRWGIAVRGDDLNNIIWFDVADYKAPSFLVSARCDGGKQALSLPDSIVFSGEVATYSGVPFGGATVKYIVDYRPHWWSSGERASFGGETVAGPEGVYRVALPAANLRNTRFESGVFTFRAIATSAAGESQESAAVVFSLGNGCYIAADIPDRIEITGDSLSLRVPVYDESGAPAIANVEYALYDADGNEVTNGVFKSPELTLQSKLLPSGRYKAKFHIEGTPVACRDNGDIQSVFIIWRDYDSVPPVETPLWIPKRNIVVPPGSDIVSIPVGNSYKDGFVLCKVMYSGSSDSSDYYEWLSPGGKMTEVHIAAPSEDQRASVEFMAVHNLEVSRESVTVIPWQQQVSMKVEAESFRNRLIPATREKWTFRLSVDSLPSVGAAAMAVLSDKALDAISPFRWYFSSPDVWWRFNGSLDMESVVGRSYVDSRGFNAKSHYNIAVPHIENYGMSLFSGQKRGMMRKSGGPIAYGASSMSAMMNRMTEEQSDDMAIEESADVVDEVAMEGVAMATGSAPSPEGEPLRDVEMPLAFFRPDLIADGSGIVTIDFEVPDFNTTWKFQMIGYDDELHNGYLTLDALAAKKVMVRSNPPRFLHTGDKAAFSALLFNNSSESLPVGGVLEVVDPLTGNVLCSRDFKPEMLAPSASRSVSLEWSVPNSVSLVYVRAYARGGGFSDGEQAAVTILPSSTPVLESAPFWIKAGEKKFEMKLPEFNSESAPAESFCTLQYCDNPVWYCVTSLPVLVDDDSEDALSLVRSLFGGSVAFSLARKYPEIRRAVEYLSSPEGATDPLMVSSLDKNPELKTLVLSMTPWTNDAVASTMRMEKLSMLLDSAYNTRLISGYIDRLSRLQNADGGFRWLAVESSSSRFITMRVLNSIALMKECGVATKDTPLDSMAGGAIRYLDNYFKDRAARRKDNFDYLGLVDYLYVRSSFSIPSSEATDAGFGKMSKKAIQAIESGWRDLSIDSKTKSAVVLWRDGRKNESLKVLASIGEFATCTPERGCWFDNIRNNYSPTTTLELTSEVLRACSEIDPDSPLLEGLRQWLVMSAQTVDWSRNPYMASAVAAVLGSGIDWISSSEPPRIFIDGKRVDIGGNKSLSGEFSCVLDPQMMKNGVLSVERAGDSPAWGGIISRTILPADEVKEQGLPQLSISKDIYLITEGEDGRKASDSPLKVGDRVRVTLKIHCDRDMEYVVVSDGRPACLEPIGQVFGYTFCDGVWFYRQMRNSATDLLISYLPKGDFVLSYECFVDRTGEYSCGIATVQSMYAPVFEAHSSGSLLLVQKLIQE